MPTEDWDGDLDVLGDWVDIVMVSSDDLFVFFARESCRMVRRRWPRAFAGLTGFLRSIDLVRVGVCIWPIPLRFGRFLGGSCGYTADGFEYVGARVSFLKIGRATRGFAFSAGGGVIVRGDKDEGRRCTLGREPLS